MFSLHEAESALSHIDSYDRDVWLRCGMALKSEYGEAAFDLFIKWSETASNFNLREAKAVWKSFKHSGIAIGTLIAIAKENGWQPSKTCKSNTSATYEINRLAHLERLKKTEEETKKLQEQAAAEAQNIWFSAGSASAAHPYLRRKMISPVGIKQKGELLIIPLLRGGQISSIQFIDGQGNKRFLKDGKTSGAYCPIGTPTNTIYICEGFATGATLHHVTGSYVVCAMSAANLSNVAVQIRQQHPNARLIIASDNDVNRVGITHAEKAAEITCSEIQVPIFPEGINGTDWNDFYIYYLKGKHNA